MDSHVKRPQAQVIWLRAEDNEFRCEGYSGHKKTLIESKRVIVNCESLLLTHLLANEVS